MGFKKGHEKIGNCGAPKGTHNSLKTEFKKGMIPWNKGTKGLMIAWNKGKECLNLRKPRKSPMSEEHKKHLSESCMGREVWNKGLKGYNSGDKHHNWQGGKTFEEYGKFFNDELKNQIRKRDNYICQKCGYSQKQLGHTLQVHHIDYNKKNINKKNLISLCNSCHCKTNYKREYWTEHFNNFKNEGDIDE